MPGISGNPQIATMVKVTGIWRITPRLQVVGRGDRAQLAGWGCFKIAKESATAIFHERKVYLIGSSLDKCCGRVHDIPGNIGYNPCRIMEGLGSWGFGRGCRKWEKIRRTSMPQPPLRAVFEGFEVEGRLIDMNRYDMIGPTTSQNVPEIKQLAASNQGAITSKTPMDVAINCPAKSAEYLTLSSCHQPAVSSLQWGSQFWLCHHRALPHQQTCWKRRSQWIPRRKQARKQDLGVLVHPA